MKKPVITYQERVRASLEAMHLRIALDPAEPAEHRQAARVALTVPTAQEFVDQVTEHAGAHRVAALRSLRSYVTGTPVANHHELVIAPVAPTTELPELPESDQGDDQNTEPPVPTRPVRQVQQATEQASAPEPMPGAYVPKVRKIEYPKYLDSPDPRDDVRKIRG